MSFFDRDLDLLGKCTDFAAIVGAQRDMQKSEAVMNETGHGQFAGSTIGYQIAGDKPLTWRQKGLEICWSGRNCNHDTISCDVLSCAVARQSDTESMHLSSIDPSRGMDGRAIIARTMLGDGSTGLVCGGRLRHNS